MRRITSFLPKQDWIVVGWVIAIKLLLFFVGVKSYPILWDKYAPLPENWLQIWDQWDFGYYHEIAEFGYGAYGAGDGSLAFYPLFPWLMRFVTYITRSYLVAGLLISGIACMVAAIALRRLVRLDYSVGVAMRSVWFFLIFPTAYFLHVPYSESLFIALALTCLMAARTEQWWIAGLLGALCWMTRGVGVVLVPALAAEAAHQYYAKRCWDWRWVWIAIVPAGFAVYLLINWHVTGNAFAFLQTRRVTFQQSFALPAAGIRLAIWAHYPTAEEAEMMGVQQLIFVALGFVCMILSWIKLRPVYAVWMTAMWFLVSSVNFLQSAPRYTLAMFPIFILFALLGRNRF